MNVLTTTAAATATATATTDEDVGCGVWGMALLGVSSFRRGVWYGWRIVLGDGSLVMVLRM